MRFSQKVVPGKAQLTTFNGIKSWSQSCDLVSVCLRYIAYVPNTVDDGNESAMRFSQKVVPGKAQLTTFNGIKSWSQQVNVNSLTHQPSTEIGNSIILLTGMTKEKALASRILACNLMRPAWKHSTPTQKTFAALKLSLLFLMKNKKTLSNGLPRCNHRFCKVDGYRNILSRVKVDSFLWRTFVVDAKVFNSKVN